MLIPIWLFQVIIALLALAASAAHGRPDGPPPPAAYHPAPVEYPHASPVYGFNYDVNNDGNGYEHQAFNQQEERNGYQTHGEYSVQLADGRIMRVVYKVDGDSGFIADVSYEGEAKPYDYTAYKPAPPKPVYHPAPAPPKPVYHPAPAPIVYQPLVHAPAPAPAVKVAPAPAPAPAAPVVEESRSKNAFELRDVKFSPFG